MKKSILLIMAMLCIVSVSAQSDIDMMMGFKPRVVAVAKLPDNVVLYLDSKINDILTQEGIAHTKSDYVLEVTVNELSKMITPTAPQRIQVKLELTFKCIDESQNVVFNSISVPATGMNISEAAAYMSAVQSVNFRTRNFLNFIQVSKDKLYEYYSAGYIEKPQEEEPAKQVVMVVDEPVDEPRVEPEPEPVVKEESTAIELSPGVYAQYIKYEQRSSTTDIIVAFINCNEGDANISMAWRDQLVVDSNGKNVKHRAITYADGSNLPGHAFTLIKDVPVAVRINYSGNIVPKVLYLQEGVRDVKVKMNCN